MCLGEVGAIDPARVGIRLRDGGAAEGGASGGTSGQVSGREIYSRHKQADIQTDKDR